MKTLLLSVIVFVVGSAASCCAAGLPLLTPAAARITDRAISADIASINALQKRLADLNNQGTPIASYHFAKAQAWLDMAMDEYVMNDRSRVVDDALQQANRLIEQLEAKKSEPGMDTEILPTSRMIRPDLWRLAAELKQSSGFSCGEDLVARLEVQLVWAGHEDNQLGWRNAKPYIQAAERLAGEARQKTETCPVGRTAAAMTGAVLSESQVSPTLVAVGNTGSTQAQTQGPSGIAEVVPDRVHFSVNSDLLGSRSVAVLERLVIVLTAHPAVQVELSGHADERGSASFNRALSLNRAEVVRAYLVAAGIDRGRITLEAFGSSQPATSGNDSGAYACNRRVEFEFTPDYSHLRPITQLEDLRIEEPGRTTDK